MNVRLKASLYNTSSPLQLTARQEHAELEYNYRLDIEDPASLALYTIHIYVSRSNDNSGWVCGSVSSHVATSRPDSNLVYSVQRPPDDLASTKQRSAHARDDLDIVTKLP